jgi:hypothetical protein
MTLLVKKAVGIVLTLLGGLTLAHGAAVGDRWEVLTGLVGLALGLGLLAAKVARRNEPTAGQPRE